MKVYIVTMHRWGNPELHNYFLGAYDNLKSAQEAGIAEYEYRGHKYEPMVIITMINNPDMTAYTEPCREG